MYIPEADPQRTDVAQLQVIGLTQETDSSYPLLFVLSQQPLFSFATRNPPTFCLNRLLSKSATGSGQPPSHEGLLVALHLEPANATQFL